MFEAHRNSSIDWRPSPVLALATSADDSQVAAAREDGSLELWLVSPGSVGWHCQLTIHGDPKSRVSSLAWCRAGVNGLPSGRLLSSSIDGSVSEWDFFLLKQKPLLETIGVSIWQMSVAPGGDHALPGSQQMGNGNFSISAHENGHAETSECKDESEPDDELQGQSAVENPRVALACDDGCVRIYTVLADEFVYTKSLPRVSGRILSVTWNSDATKIFSGSSDGLIRCWDPTSGHEIYRITVGLGGLGSDRELCVWSLLSLRSGTLVSADSTGSVQFWDIKHGTLLLAHSYHKGDVNALAAAPGHNRVYSAGADGQVILYKLSNEATQSVDSKSADLAKKWTYVGYVRAHSHDVRALTVASPISEAPISDDEDILPNIKRRRHKEKPIDFSYHKWAQLGVPMLISAGDDTKLYAYSAKEFTQFAPHDICPAPQRPPIHLVQNTVFNQSSLVLVQASSSLDILCVKAKNGALNSAISVSSGGTSLVAQVKSKASRRIICSTMSNSGRLFSYSDHVKPSLFELKCKTRKSSWNVEKRPLPSKLPYAHAMVFSCDSSRLMIAGHDRRIYVVDVVTAEIKHVFTPSNGVLDEKLPPSEPPITKLFTSSDGQWLAAINCFGDIYVFNLETLRQHWFKSRVDGASVTAGGFPPRHNNVLLITTSKNKVYALDVEAKENGHWSNSHSHALPTRFQEFPGEVIGLSFPPSNSSSVIVYSARSLCRIDFALPVCQEDEIIPANEVVPANGGIRKPKRDYEIILGRKNFDFFGFRDPVLFIGHLSDSSIFIIDKPWTEVVRNFEAQPVHRHIYGT